MNFWDGKSIKICLPRLQVETFAEPYLHAPLAAFFLRACTCQLMLLNSSYCIQHSCPSAHVRFCVFVSLVANKYKMFLKPDKEIIQYWRYPQGKRYPIYDFLFVQVSISKIWYFRPAEHLSFTNLSSLNEIKCFWAFLIFAYLVYSLFTFVLVVWYVTTLLMGNVQVTLSIWCIIIFVD